MVRRIALTLSFAAASALGLAGRAAAATGTTTLNTRSYDGYTFTGNAEKDLPNPAVGTTNGVTVIGNDPIGNGSPYHVYQDPTITAAGRISGWNIKDVRLSYDAKTDTEHVAVNTFGIAGDADGNGIQGAMDPKLKGSGGIENPNLGGRESIAVRFNFSGDKSQDVIAGVPADKSPYGPGGAYAGLAGTDGFLVAQVKSGNDKGISANFGTPLFANSGNLLFDPSAAHPSFEFTIKNFSKLPGYNPATGFQVSAFAGSPDDIIAGEDTTRFTQVSPEVVICTGPQCIPEPASILGWSVLAAVGAWRVGRRRKAS